MSIVDLNSSEFKPWLNPNVNVLTAKNMHVSDLALNTLTTHDINFLNTYTTYTGGQFYFLKTVINSTFTAFGGGSGTSAPVNVYVYKIGPIVLLQFEDFSINISGSPFYVEMDQPLPNQFLLSTTPNNGNHLSSQVDPSIGGYLMVYSQIRTVASGFANKFSMVLIGGTFTNGTTQTFKSGFFMFNR